MFLAFGMVSALLRAARTGRGDVVDAAICDGTNALMTMIHSRRAMGRWRDERAANLLDGGAPWYGVYECADGGWVAVGALEPQFWACMLDLLGLTPEEMGDRADRAAWPAIRERLAATFRARPRDAWAALFEGTDACVAPVLSPAEARAHPHNRARGAFAPEGPDQPMPAPRFAEAQTPLPGPPPRPGADSRAVLEAAGLAPHRIAALLRSGAVA